MKTLGRMSIVMASGCALALLPAALYKSKPFRAAFTQNVPTASITLKTGYTLYFTQYNTDGPGIVAFWKEHNANNTPGTHVPVMKKVIAMRGDGSRVIVSKALVAGSHGAPLDETEIFDATKRLSIRYDYSTHAKTTYALRPDEVLARMDYRSASTNCTTHSDGRPLQFPEGVIGAGEVSGRPVIIINSAADETKWWRDPELNCEALKFVSTGQTAPGGDLFSQQEMELDGITMGEPDRALFDTSQGVEMKPSDAYRVRLRFMGFADVEIHKLLEENKRTLDNQDARYARSRPK